MILLKRSKMEDQNLKQIKNTNKESAEKEAIPGWVKVLKELIEKTQKKNAK